MRDAADMVDVSLREDDIRRRPGADRIEQALVRQRFEAHAGVDDEAPSRGHEQVGIRQAGRLRDEVVDADRLLEIRVAVGEEIVTALDRCLTTSIRRRDSTNALSAAIYNNTTLKAAAYTHEFWQALTWMEPEQMLDVARTRGWLGFDG